jgi:hypothetical protein
MEIPLLGVRLKMEKSSSGRKVEDLSIFSVDE